VKTRRFLYFFLVFLISISSFASQQYLQKFNTYQYWYTHLPPSYHPEIVKFINQPGPLAQQLRNKWLSLLGEKKNWTLYAQYYRPTNITSLQCYAATAYWKLNLKDKAVQIVNPLWLSGHPQPNACNEIFHLLNQNPNWHARYWRLRIIKALDSKELLLARQLLNRGQHVDQIASSNFWRLHNQPEFFMRLPNGPWKGEQTLYALKRLVELNRKSALHFYQLAQTRHLLSADQNQKYIAHQALFAFMRDDKQASTWMARLNKAYYTPVLLEWQMRNAILHQQWSKVAYAIHQQPKPYQPDQMYWLAQAENHLNLKTQSQMRLKQLSKQRNYYGFLASRQLHQAPSFQENASCRQILLPYEYQPILNEINRLYRTNTLGRAAQMLNDFILELPQNEKCALVQWVANTLNWPTEAIALSNQPALFNQISVRFPTKYAQFIIRRAQQVHLDPAFVYAIIRQESAFHPSIVSPVGARGLMQMMPKTAKLITRNYHIPYRLDAELFTPYKNIEIGTQYLAHLSNLFGRHPLLVAAAYNAGPQAVHRWIKQYPSKDIEAWIDTLPWRETRNYLKNIISFQVIYQHRLGLKPNMEQMLRRFPRGAFKHDRKHF
jgi:soluble lytic murein transglycosylase